MRRAMALVGGLVFALTVARSLEAAFLVVPNGSFEDPSLAVGSVGIAVSVGDPAGWIGSDPSRVGVRYEKAGLPSYFLPGYPNGVDDGLQSAFVVGSGSLTSAPLDPIASGTLYTLTVAVGRRNNLDPVGDYWLELLADGATIAASQLIDGDLISKGTWYDLHLSYLSPVSGGPVGQSLSVRLHHRAETDFQWGDFDNVRLDASPLHAAEPSGLTAWASLAAVGLIAYLRRRRWR